MFKHTVTYNDFNGVQHVEDLYFHIMVPEFADLQFNPNFDGDMAEYIKEAMRSDEAQKVYTFFKLMIVNSYGRRVENGAEFYKKSEWTERFLNSLAYEEFFIWLIVDPNNGADFFNALVPPRMVEMIAAAEEKKPAEEKLKKPQDMTKEELLALMQQRLADKTPANEVAAS